MMRRILPIAVIALAGVVVAAVSAAPAPVTPNVRTVSTSMRPVFRWHLPSTEVTESVGVATSPATGPTGEFVPKNIVGLDAVEADATSYTFEQSFAAGKYWWHVASHDTATASGHLFSPPQPFTIRPAVSKPTVTLQFAGRSFLATSHWKANVGTVAVTGRLFNGTKTLATKQSKASALLGQAGQDFSTWNVPSTVKAGTALRFTLTVAIPGTTVKATTTKTFKAR